MKRMVVASLASALSWVAWAQEAPNEALYRVQQRNAAILGGLVNQTPEYQKGYALRLEAVRQREAAEAAAYKEAGKTTAGRESLSREDQAKIDNLNSDIQRVTETKGQTVHAVDAKTRALRDQQRQIYNSAGLESPIAPEPPPRPIVHSEHSESRSSPPPPVTYHKQGNFLHGSDGSTKFCTGNFCN